MREMLEQLRGMVGEECAKEIFGLRFLDCDLGKTITDGGVAGDISPSPVSSPPGEDQTTSELMSDSDGRYIAPQYELRFPVEVPKAGSWVGFKLPVKISELNTPEEIKAACAKTTIECYWCGFEIEDTPQMRRRLNDSYEQEYRRTVMSDECRVMSEKEVNHERDEIPETPGGVAATGTVTVSAAERDLSPPGKNGNGVRHSDEMPLRENGGRTARYTPEGYSVGFWNPDPASMFVPFAQTMETYVKAVKSKDQGNLIPMADFYKSNWATPWDPDLDKKSRLLEMVEGSYETDPLQRMPEFHSRNMAVDSQKDLKAGPMEDRVGSFWVWVQEFDKAGNSRQLFRGFCPTWEHMLAVQRWWKVPNQRLCIDASKWGPQIEAMAALNFEVVKPKLPNPRTGSMDPFAAGWRLFYGDDKAQFLVDGRSSAVSPGQTSRPYYVARGDRKYGFYLYKYRWSNLAFERQLEAILDGGPGMAKFETLPREALKAIAQNLTADNANKTDIKDKKLIIEVIEETLKKEQGILTLEQQMSARYKGEVRGKEYYLDIKNREAHYRDCALMLLVRASQDGLLGHVQE